MSPSLGVSNDEIYSFLSWLPIYYIHDNWWVIVALCCRLRISTNENQPLRVIQVWDKGRPHFVNRGRNRFSHRKWEFALWRVRVLTLAGESSHFGGWDFSPCCTESESSHSGGWEFSLWLVRFLTVLGESSPYSRWDFTMWWVKVIIRGWALGESSYRWVRVFTALGEDFPSGEWKVRFAGESLTVVGETWVKVLTPWRVKSL